MNSQLIALQIEFITVMSILKFKKEETFWNVMSKHYKNPDAETVTRKHFAKKVANSRPQGNFQKLPFLPSSYIKKLVTRSKKLLLRFFQNSQKKTSAPESF